MYTKAMEWGRCKENPAQKVKLFKGEVKRVRFLMHEEIQKLFTNCNEYLKPMVVVALHTGSRKSELFGLQWNQINFEQGIIKLTDTKNNERRDISMHETVKTTIREMENKGPFVFGGQKRRDFLYVYRSFREVVQKSGISNFRRHDMRHCFVSLLVIKGADIMTVKELMGRKTLEMTLRYSHLAPSYKTKAVNILDRVMI
jgi:integrase